MKLLKISIVLLTLVVFMGGCKKDFDPGATTTVKSSNDWWANLYLNGVEQYGSPKAIVTYNAALSPDSLWVDDGGNLWDFKVKCGVDNKNLTFSSPTDAVNENYNITVNITDGKILPLAGKSKSGNPTDSIYMKIEFSDDPGNVYEIKGTARTKFKEDEY
jgi:hypothetical protein